jgi:hypothetical protein
MADLWDNINSALDAVGKGNDVYLDIKEGNKSTQISEAQLQGTYTNISSWTQPAVIVGIAGVAIAIIGLIFFRGSK